MLDYYVRAGIVAYAVDHQGHGKSEGVKPRKPEGHVGHVRSFDDIAHDAWQLVEEVAAKQYPGVPVYFHGHCMGGAHVLRALQLRRQEEYPKCLKAIILSAPSYMVPPEAKPSPVVSRHPPIHTQLAQPPVCNTCSYMYVPTQVMKALACMACCAPNVVVADWPDRNDADLDVRFYNDPFCTPTPFSAHYANQLNKVGVCVMSCHLHEPHRSRACWRSCITSWRRVRHP